MKCAVCGHTVERDDIHTQLDVTHKYLESPDEQETYVLHNRCAINTIDSWQRP